MKKAEEAKVATLDKKNRKELAPKTLKGEEKVSTSTVK